MRWKLSSPEQREGLLRALSTRRRINVGAGSESTSYQLAAIHGGRPRRLVDVDYDSGARLAKKGALVRHRTTLEAEIPDHHPLRFSQLGAMTHGTLDALMRDAPWSERRQQVQFEQTTGRVGAVWFSTAAGSCTIKGVADEGPPCAGLPLEPDEVVRGALPDHPASQSLRRAFPGLAQRSLTPVRKVERLRYRIALQPSEDTEMSACPAFPLDLSVDLVTISKLGLDTGATNRGSTTELELAFDTDRRLRDLPTSCVRQRMEQIATMLGTTATLEPLAEAWGELHVPDRCELDACETELAKGETDPSDQSPEGRARARSRRRENNGRAIWCGARGEVTFEDLALRAAPILWFSPDEPLLHEGRRGCAASPEVINIPWSWEPNRCERERDGCEGKPEACERRVYYRVEKVNGRDPGLDPNSYDTQHVSLADTRKLDLRYFFYYPRDLGTNGHLCDLESAWFEIKIDELEQPTPTGVARYRANLTYAKAAAHALHFRENRLSIGEHWWAPRTAPDTLLPFTILVEEGKHGSGTDRNGDGVFTPGYDVNFMVTDAWGVRDTFGSGLLKRGYSPEQTKPRRPEHRIFPDLPWLHPLRARYEDRNLPWNEAASYTLKPAVPLPASARERKEYACVEPAKKEKTLWVGLMDHIPFSWRYDGDRSVSMVTFPVPLGVVWATPRALFATGRGWDWLRGLGVHLTPSLGRWLDWYGALGWQRIAEHARFRSAFTYELGVRFRVKPLWLDQHLPFLGLRAGLRLEGLRRPGRAHLVVEVGGGFQ
jgi:hypothetical protein